MDKNNIFLDKYVIIKQIGSGSFGEVYSAINMKTYTNLAVKVEERNEHNMSKKERIIYEYKIYCYLNNKGFTAGLPKVHDLLQTPMFNIMVMDLLGPNLEELFIKNNKKFSLNTVLGLALNFIELLEKLHKNNYIHRDIKPSNFLIDLNKNSNKIYIMDFGLSKKYMLNKKHIEFKIDRNFIGTARYASNNVHNGFEPSRRDDLESIGYILIYFLKGKLPWQGLKKQKGIKHTKTIGNVKSNISLDVLCSNLPLCFKQFLQYCKNLKFYECPDYKYLKNLFINYCYTYKILIKYDWIKN